MTLTGYMSGLFAAEMYPLSGPPERAYGYAADGACYGDMTVMLVPALEPVADAKFAEDPDAVSDAILAERVQGLAARKPLRHVEATTDCGGTCPRCTGPVATLLSMSCQGPGWREEEPTVRELWVGFRRDKRPGETGIRDVLFAPCPGAERWWQASGRGHAENHPIREEAIRLWREAVRGGR